MDDQADRTFNELIEFCPLFLEALKDEYDILMNIINIIFSSCSIITKTETIGRGVKEIVCEAFDCFFEYQIYKIMEKYRHYDKIKTQICIIDNIHLNRRSGDLKLKSDINKHLSGPDIFKWLFMYYYRRYDTIVIHFDDTYHTIKVEDKYKQDMLNLFKNY